MAAKTYSQSFMLCHLINAIANEIHLQQTAGDAIPPVLVFSGNWWVRKQNQIEYIPSACIETLYRYIEHFLNNRLHCLSVNLAS